MANLFLDNFFRRSREREKEGKGWRWEFHLPRSYMKTTVRRYWISIHSTTVYQASNARLIGRVYGPTRRDTDCPPVLGKWLLLSSLPLSPLPLLELNLPTNRLRTGERQLTKLCALLETQSTRTSNWYGWVAFSPPPPRSATAKRNRHATVFFGATFAMRVPCRLADVWMLSCHTREKVE